MVAGEWDSHIKHAEMLGSGAQTMEWWHSEQVFPPKKCLHRQAGGNVIQMILNPLKLMRLTITSSSIFLKHGVGNG